MKANHARANVAQTVSDRISRRNSVEQMGTPRYYCSKRLPLHTLQDSHSPQRTLRCVGTRGAWRRRQSAPCAELTSELPLRQPSLLLQLGWPQIPLVWDLVHFKPKKRTNWGSKPDLVRSCTTGPCILPTRSRGALLWGLAT